MSSEKLTGKPLFRKIIGDIVSGEDTPQKNMAAFRYHVQHTFGSIVGQMRNARYWKEEPDSEHVELLENLLKAVPNVLEYCPEEVREDLESFLKSEGFIKNE